jgi:aspartate kinase
LAAAARTIPATILGAALDALGNHYLDRRRGVKTADPRLVPEARTIPEISYNEAAELAFFGAKVLHPNTLRPVTAAGVPVWIRNSFAPEKARTKITPTACPPAAAVKALTAIRDVTLITVGGPGNRRPHDVLARSFAATSPRAPTYFLVSQSSSQNDICFVISAPTKSAPCTRCCEAFAPEIDEQNRRARYCQPRHRDRRRRRRKHARRTRRRRPHLLRPGPRKHQQIMAIAPGLRTEYNISLVVQESAMQRRAHALHPRIPRSTNPARRRNSIAPAPATR